LVDRWNGESRKRAGRKERRVVRRDGRVGPVARASSFDILSRCPAQGQTRLLESLTLSFLVQLLTASYLRLRLPSDSSVLLLLPPSDGLSLVLSHHPGKKWGMETNYNHDWTARTFKPNVVTKVHLSTVLNAEFELPTTTMAIRQIYRKGGFDNYLVSFASRSPVQDPTEKGGALRGEIERRERGG
jgi:ribosomal protein L28